MRTLRPAAATAPRADVLASAVPVVVAIAYTVGIFWARAVQPPAPYSYDIYNAHFPNAVYAQHALARGFGLLWIGVQNCGQPFLPTSLLGPFYPADWLLLLWKDPTPGFFVAAALHLAIGGIGTYALCRTLGAGVAGALAGAVTFQLCASSVSIATWVPTSIFGAYAWMPAAWAAFERLLDRPDVERAAALAVIVALQVLAGYPQIVLFTYEVIGARLLVGLVPGPTEVRRRRLAWAVVALALPVALAAVYLLPEAEFARLSVRGRTMLTTGEFAPTPTTWQQFSLDAGFWIFQWVPSFTLVGTLLAPVVLVAARRPRAIFYFATCILFLALPWDTPLLAAYRRLPVAGMFRDPIRFIWVSTTAFAAAVGCGLDGLLAAAARPPRRRLATAGAVLLGVAAFCVIARRQLTPWELGIGLAAAAAIVLALGGPRGARVATVALPLLVGWNLLLFGRHPFARFAPDASMYHRKAGAYEALRARMTSQDRFLSLGIHADYSNTEKSASLFDVPSIVDYEPQTSQRYAELLVYLWAKQPMQSINDYYYHANYVPYARRLFDLLAARYVLWDPATKLPVESIDGLVELGRPDGLVLYENPRALPRAFFVPRLEVVPDGVTTLARLNEATFDPRQVAFVAEPPADGFLGDPTPSRGTARIVADHSEDLSLEVESSGNGFVFVSDQLYPGWTAMVNGVDAPIVRANYAFRAVRVPPGRSTVVMRYRPPSLVIGAAVSLASAVGLGVAVARARRRAA